MSVGRHFATGCIITTRKTLFPQGLYCSHPKKTSGSTYGLVPSRGPLQRWNFLWSLREKLVVVRCNGIFSGFLVATESTTRGWRIIYFLHILCTICMPLEMEHSLHIRSYDSITRGSKGNSIQGLLASLFIISAFTTLRSSQVYFLNVLLNPKEQKRTGKTQFYV